MSAVGKVSGNQPPKKAASDNKYDLSTKEGKIAYLKDLNSEINKLMSIKYAAFKDKPNYPEFAKNVNAQIQRNEKAIQNIDNVTMSGIANPKTVADVTLNKAASSSRLLSLREKVDDAFKALE